jgi:hypothetical protein
MIYLAYPDGTPVFAATTHMTTKRAERAASRRLGKDWRERGYRVCYDDRPRSSPDPGRENPRNAPRIFGTPPVALLTDWHKG